MNNTNVTYPLFIDLKKAFDTINHKILVKKLSKIGLPHNTVKWLTSYLSNRAQRTQVNNSLSDIKAIEWNGLDLASRHIATYDQFKYLQKRVMLNELQ